MRIPILLTHSNVFFKLRIITWARIFLMDKFLPSLLLYVPDSGKARIMPTFASYHKVNAYEYAFFFFVFTSFCYLET